jgi:ubiquitin carboxyl-terminal hydrolase 4/11/15
LLRSDAVMNDGLPMPSIEDEGIDVDYIAANSFNNLTSVGLHSNSIQSSWNFSGLKANRPNNFISGTGSEIDGNESPADELDVGGSDVVQDASSASSGSRKGRLEDFDNAIPEDDDGAYVDDNPVPDIEDENQLDNLALHRDLLQARRDGALLRPEFKVSVEEDDGIEEPATEIHVEEGEGIKLD